MVRRDAGFLRVENPQLPLALRGSECRKLEGLCECLTNSQMPASVNSRHDACSGNVNDSRAVADSDSQAALHWHWVSQQLCPLSLGASAVASGNTHKLGTLCTDPSGSQGGRLRLPEHCASESVPSPPAPPPQWQEQPGPGSHRVAGSLWPSNSLN